MAKTIFRIMRVMIAIYFMIATYGIIRLELFDWRSIINIIINVLIILYFLFYTKIKIWFVKYVKINRK